MVWVNTYSSPPTRQVSKLHTEVVVGASHESTLHVKVVSVRTCTSCIIPARCDFKRNKRDLISSTLSAFLNNTRRGEATLRCR